MNSAYTENTHTLYLDLCRKHRKFIHNFTKRRIKNEADVDEIVQEVFLRAFSSFESLMSHPNERGWLVETTKNIIREYAKFSSKQHRTFERLSSLDAIIRSYCIDNNDYSDLFDDLSKDDKSAISLYYAMGYSASEVAKELNISENATKKRLSRARKKLEKKLKHRNLLK